MNTKINKWIKKEMRRMKKARKECAKKYPDWVDDEFNMLEDKFIWGVLHDPNSKETTPSFCTLNKACIYYNRETHLYYLMLDTDFFACDTQESRDAFLDYLREIKAAMLNFIFETDDDGIIVHDPVSLVEICDHGIMGETIEEIYFKFLILYYGFSAYYN